MKAQGAAQVHSWTAGSSLSFFSLTKHMQRLIFRKIPSFRDSVPPVKGQAISEPLARGLDSERSGSIAPSFHGRAREDPKPLVGIRSLGKSAEAIIFEDVTVDVGILQPIPSLKFGGPFIADFNNDGFYDLVLSFHNGIRTRIYFGEENGTFTLDEFIPKRRDIHGVTSAHRTAQSLQSILAISVGGGMGTNLKETEIYSISPDRVITDISDSDGLGKRASRGRNIVFMDLALRENSEKWSNKGGPDMVVTNFLGSKTSGLVQFAYENVQGNFKLRELPGFQYQVRGRVAVTDIDGDGVMELISIRSLEIFRLVAPFTFEKVNRDVMPQDFEVPPLSINAVAEIDFDNDGDFDLYIARADRTVMTNRPELEDDDYSDYLFENRNGKYVDVTENSGILTGSNSMGVTTGDFNNDGFVDIVVIRYREPDVLLLNNGDGTFKKVEGLIPKDVNTVGNHAVAVDYDFDGRMDIFVGHGDVDTIEGKYLVMKGQLQSAENSRYLLVTVANDPTRGATALHAVVTVFVDGQRLTRRIGSPGTQGGGESYITTVHFGIGSFTQVECVRVQWTNGVNAKVTDVAADQRITFGVE